MSMSEPNTLPSPDNLEVARQCLELIAEVAQRCLDSSDEELIGYALQELTQVLLEPTGSDEVLFEPVPASAIPGLRALHEELDFVNCSSQALLASYQQQRGGLPT